jgi:serine/threonine protein kinase/tetratricopeptide (TPR) repeat protein
MTFEPGAQLGAYRIVSAIGAGGMGEVYRAHDPRLDRDVAIKVLAPALAGNAEWLARFEREARMVAALSHPNIVVIHSVEEDRGIRFLTMELVDGERLDRLIRQGRIGVQQALAIGVPLADALVAAHARGVIHRDLKPGNVMVTEDGRVKVLDFGLAQPAPVAAADGDETRTAPTPITTGGDVMGTVPYMSPEQLRGGRVDARSDVFALGIVLYELLSGHRPFAGASAADVTSAILRDAPAPLRAPDVVPADLMRIVMRCLQKQPDLRVQTARDVRTELELVRRAVDSGRLPAGSVAPAAEPVPSIAVLPFVNRSQHAADDYFSDGMTEDVIAQLCKVRTLHVTSRASVMPFRESQLSIQDIASQLNVATILEGTVRRLGDRVRIVVQLIDAASGRNLWAETYDRQLTDIFAIQTDVALRIADALKAELSSNEQRRIRSEPTRDVQAYEHYLRGRHAFTRFTTPEIFRSIEHFRAAIDRDPEFALAFVGLSMAFSELGEHGSLGRAEAGQQALAAAEKGVALGPDLGEAHCALAFARLVYHYDWSAAEAGYRRAIELSPSYADAYDLYGRMCMSLERHEEAISLVRRANELDPLAHRVDLATALLRAGRAVEAERAAAAGLAVEPNDARLQATLGWTQFQQGRQAEGILALERAVAMSPEDDMWRGQLGEAYALAGRRDEARAILRELEDPTRPEPASPYHRAYVYAGLGEDDRAIDCLERAFENRAGAMYGLRGSFLFTSLRRHPRFVALTKRMGLPT